MANGDAPPAAPDAPHFDTRFLVQTPDGSTATQVLRTDRPISTDELVGHLAQQGSTFVGYPDPPATAAPSPAPAAPPPSDGGAPSPVPAAPPDTGFHPTAWQRTQGIFGPERSYASQLPSIGGAILGGGAASVTGPFAPYVAPFTAAAGSALGEVGDIAYEKLTGAPPAEPASAWDRVQNAAIRGGTFEGLTAPVQWALRPVVNAVKPIAAAVGDLLPVLRQDLPAGVQAVENIATGLPRSIDNLLGHDDQEVVSKILANPSLKLSPEGSLTLLRSWYQRQAGQAPAAIANAWETLSGAAQEKLAGALREPMQTLINTFKTGQALPKVAPALYTGASGAVGGTAALLGHPVAAAALGVPGLVSAAGEAVPYVASRMALDPTRAAVLSWLPRAAQVAAPLSRFGVQSLGTREWPLASTLSQGGR